MNHNPKLSVEIECEGHIFKIMTLIILYIIKLYCSHSQHNETIIVVVFEVHSRKIPGV